MAQNRGKPLVAGIEMSTEFYRVYETSSNSKISDLLDVTRWMHTIEPTVGYSL